MDILKLSIDKHITEVKSPLLFNLAKDKGKKILINSEMATGKTHFVLNELIPYLNNKNINTLIVAPVTILIDQIGARTTEVDKLGLYYSKHKDSLTTPNIATTPDSSLKVASSWEEQNKDFFVVIDEAHEEQFSQSFRQSFKNIEELSKIKGFCGAIYMTATGQNVKKYFSNNFDLCVDISKRELIEAGGKTIKNPNKKSFANQTIIKSMTQNYDNILNFISQVRRENPTSTIAIKIDNKEIINSIGGGVETVLKEKFNSLTSNRVKQEVKELEEAEEQQERELKEDIKSYKLIEGKRVLCFTRILNSGVEVNNSKDTILINFINNNSYTEENEIQLLGRFRNGVKKYYLIFQGEQEEGQAEEQTEAQEQQKAPLQTVETIYKEQKIIHKSIIKVLNSPAITREQKSSLLIGFKAIEVIEEIGQTTYNLNKIILKAQCITEHQRELIKDKEKLKNYLVSNYEYVLGAITIDNTEVQKEEATKEHLEFIKELQKIKKEAREKDKDKLKEILQEQEAQEIDNILSKQVDQLPKEQRALFDRLSEVKEENKTISSKIKEFISIGLTEGQFWELWARGGTKAINYLLDCYRLATYNTLFINDKPSFEQLPRAGGRKINKEILRHYKTIKYFEGQGLKNSKRITRKNVKDLIYIYSSLNIKIYKEVTESQGKTKEEQKKSLDKAIKELRDYLGKIFIIHKDNNNLKISSIRTNIEDLF